MRKIASMNIDLVDHVINNDDEVGVIKLAQIVESLSEDAQIAYIPSIEELELKQDRDFAAILWDPKIGSLRKFANYNSELTELNMAFLVDSKNSLPEEVVKIAATNLTCAASKYRLSIPEELEEYKSDKFINNMVDLTAINNVGYLTKTATKNKKATYYALQEQKKYPIETDMQVKKAASFFDKNNSKLNINDKLEFIANIQDRAKELNVSLSKTAVEKYANLSKDLFNEDFYNNVKVRISYLKDSEEEIKTAYEELISRADELGPLDSAYVLEEIDKTASLAGTYGRGLYDPLIATLGEEKRAGREIDGSFISQDQLRKIDEGVLTSLVGNDVIKELKSESGLDILESLPTPIRKDIIEQL
jgi:hypothetical protein